MINVSQVDAKSNDEWTLDGHNIEPIEHQQVTQTLGSQHNNDQQLSHLPFIEKYAEQTKMRHTHFHMKVPSNYKNVSLQTHHLMRNKPVPAIFALEGEYDETMFTRNHKNA